MIIVRNGIDTHAEAECKYLHKNLGELANFIEELNDQDLAISEMATTGCGLNRCLKSFRKDEVPPKNCFFARYSPLACSLESDKTRKCFKSASCFSDHVVRRNLLYSPLIQVLIKNHLTRLRM